MNVKFIQKHVPSGTLVLSIQKATQIAVDGDTYESGQLEALQGTVTNLTNLVATLMSMMNLTDEQLTELLGNYERKVTHAP